MTVEYTKIMRSSSTWVNLVNPLQRYFVGRFSFHLLYLSCADARKCTIHFQDFAIVHAYVLIN